LPSQDLLGLSLHPIDPIDGSQSNVSTGPGKTENLGDKTLATESKNSTLQLFDTSASSKGLKYIFK